MKYLKQLWFKYKNKQKEKKLLLLKQILEEANLRQYTCINNFGYSFIERKIVDVLCFNEKY